MSASSSLLEPSITLARLRLCLENATKTIANSINSFCMANVHPDHPYSNPLDSEIWLDALKLANTPGPLGLNK
ncbi:hypothetical protein [Prochlorococcus marinus]|uniref:hypothetical protein n=1 Tax=Prochlorococcus TaxID=1218 RepID=UPI0012DA0870|nr:hypothetical protein [Prochlorococcus marinus]